MRSGELTVSASCVLTSRDENRRPQGAFVQRLTHGEVPAYNNAELLIRQAMFWELDGTVTLPTHSPSGHLGEGLL